MFHHWHDLWIYLIFKVTFLPNVSVVETSDICTEHSCWLKATQTFKAMLLLCWTHRVKNSTVVITNWGIDTKISISQRQRIFIFFPLSSVWRLPADLTMSNMTGVLWELSNMTGVLWELSNTTGVLWELSNTTGVLWELLTLREQVCSPYVFGGVRVARLFMFSVLYFCCLSPFCVLWPILPVFLDCPSGFSNIWLILIFVVFLK